MEGKGLSKRQRGHVDAHSALSSESWKSQWLCGLASVTQMWVRTSVKVYICLWNGNSNDKTTKLGHED